jgi:hypothetical protein
MPDYSRLVFESWNELYPDKPLRYPVKLRYSGHFKGFNASIVLRGGVLTVNLSKNWRPVDPSIKKGVIQELMCKFTKDRRKSSSIELYKVFLKHAHIGVPKTKSDPVLDASFDRVNQEYFSGFIEKPNLVWSEGINRLGFYDYGADTIALSRILAPHQELLDYIMYHEMLHKKHKFKGSGRTIHHSKEFREDERRFKDAARLENELSRLVRRHRWRWSRLLFG